ncbi:Uncharacterised protein [Fusobacterium necrophorum subsp. necrophorum]|nr:Uncharacterised protein [Fusobacterium necrophorum subsp. necrophorum]
MIEYSRKEGFEAEVLLFSFERGSLGQVMDFENGRRIHD